MQKSFVEAKDRFYDEHSKLIYSTAQLNYDLPIAESSWNHERFGDDPIPLRLNDRHSTVPLSRLYVLYFDGKRDEWEAFRDMFQAIVH